MRVFEIHQAFGLDNLRLTERSEPTLGPGQVLVRMNAVSLNYRDLLMVRGMYNPRQPLPLIPCSDGVGTVVGLGKGVRRVKEGDRVAALFAQGWISGEPSHEKLRTSLGGPLDGTLTELMVLDAEGVVPVPEHLTDEEAATLPCAALTAWSALVTQGEVRAGDTVLIQGTGGVSIFALQFALQMGARTIVTSSSDQKLQRARELGAHEVLNYRTEPEWGKKALELTEGRGVDHVVEVGGAGTLEQSLKAVRFGGALSVIGVLSGVSSPLNILPILMKNVRLQGILVGHREGFEAMNRAISVSRLRPIVDRSFPFEDTPQAFEFLASGGHFGKICLRL
ncbi:MAG: NAD(P)-dependent alcohol dehydrogenase [Deltaproteobacteria bacterium]|nr:NAD(P)-dependent alcohol dehydrogenase [Deltaproteobacteria bacterium]